MTSRRRRERATLIATMKARETVTVRAMAAGGVSSIVGTLMGIVIATAGRRRLL